VNEINEEQYFGAAKFVWQFAILKGGIASFSIITSITKFVRLRIKALNIHWLRFNYQMNCIVILRTNFNVIHSYLASIKPQACKNILNWSALIGKIPFLVQTHYLTHITIRACRR